jgi:hypothetical protein
LTMVDLLSNSKKTNKGAVVTALKGEKYMTVNIAEKTINNVEKDAKLEMQSAASAPVAELPTAKRISHLKLGPALLKAKASQAEINKAFTASFNSRGVTNQNWINGRIAIYMRIAQRAAAKVATAKRQAKANAVKPVIAKAS